ncbi:MAG TPA: SurA N-terminal domain-containing protein [Cyclobacteriaceae bacterium]|nr:SurA N-terminal domain-containing protein [Cyclobacteriaceae bacterium]
MALIKKIRQRTGLAIGVIAVGLIFFVVGGDLLGPNSTILGNNRNVVGEIAGEEITFEEYMQRVEQAKLSFQQNTGRNPSENELSSIREQAWQALIVERVFSEQYEELGLTVSDAELVDMVQGKNIVPELRQQLTNPETGEFDRQQLITFLQSLQGADPQQQAFWAQQEKLFADARLRIKYDNLLGTSDYATTIEGKMEHKMASTSADVSHLFIPYYAVADSLVSVSESEMRDYLKRNREKFKVSDARDIEYVQFSLTPSAEDSATTINEIKRLTEELRSSDNDSLFAFRNSEGAQPFRTILPGEALPNELASNVENPEVGAVYGPYLTSRSSYVSYKITDRFDGTPRMRASHILLSTQGLDDAAKEEVRKQAQEVLEEVRAGGNFAIAAQQYGQDGTAQRGGDLGWFAEEDFIEEFSKATFAVKTTGIINQLVETEYGFHIINVTELPQTLSYKLATIELELLPSDVTRNDIFRNADFFASNSKNAKEFRSNAEQEGYRIISAHGISPNARNINNLTGAREVVRWAFTDAGVGDVSEIFELDNAYVVALLTAKTEEGYAELKDVQDQVVTMVRNEKKAQYIADKIKGMNSLEEMKNVFGDVASLGNTPDLKLSATVLPGVGYAPKAIGTIFGLTQAGAISKPVQEEIGVIVAKLNAITPAPEIGDYSRYQNQLTANSSQRASYMVMMALEELAEVKDYRYKFF